MNEANPDVKKLEWKDAMLKRYETFTDVAILKEYSTRYLRKAIRVNTIKVDVDTVKNRLQGRWKLEPVPWCKEGFWIEDKGGERTDVGNLLEHALGYIYVQDPASMIPPLVLHPTRGSRVLDVCAAPGSKTTQLAAMMQNTGVIVANDLTHDRLAALGINIQRMGARNVVMTQQRGQDIKGQFDFILLDAPCSATGTIRRSPASLKQWSVGLVKRITEVQRSLLRHAWTLLAPGGYLVYSTCSLEPEENEAMVDWFLSVTSDADIGKIELSIRSSGALKEFEGKLFHHKVSYCLRILPQDNDTEGFFVAKLHKRT